MYIPEQYKIKETSKLLSFIDKWNFADLVTSSQGKIMSNKVPLLVDSENNILYGHLGRSNEQLNELEIADDLMVIFSGLHSYISPQWYESKGMVPTWNFETVQVKGKANLVDSNELIEILTKLTRKHESQFNTQWVMENLGPDKLEKMLNFIVGFKIEIKEIKGKQKFSQNRSDADRKSVINALEQQEDQMAQLMAEQMQIQLFNK